MTGASGQLGGYLLAILRRDGETSIIGWSGRTTSSHESVEIRPVDLRSREAIRAAFASAGPTIVVHAAAVSRIDVCHQQPELARTVNTDATRWLAELAAERGARMVYTSTDLVFDGRRGAYDERDEASPLSHYGRTKLDAEEAVTRMPRGLVMRMSLLHGPTRNGKHDSFFERQRDALLRGVGCELFDDEWRTPLDLSTAASAIVAAARAEVAGLLHLGGPERLSRWDMGRKLAEQLGVSADLVRRASSAGRFPEPRPRDVSLDSRAWRRLFPDHPWPTMSDSLRGLLSCIDFSRHDGA